MAGRSSSSSEACTIFFDFSTSAAASRTGSGIKATPMFGDAVEKGWGAVSASRPVSALNNSVFPTFGYPTIPRCAMYATVALAPAVQTGRLRCIPRRCDESFGDRSRFLGYNCRSSDRARASHLPCLLYTSDAADDLLCVDLGGRRI